MDGLLVGEVAPLGDFDRIDLADQIGHRDVGRRQLLGIAPLASDPFDFQLFAELGRPPPAGAANWPIRIVVDLAALDRRHALVEQVGEQSDEPRLGLSALAEKDHVMAGEHAVFDFGQHALVVADDAGQDALARAQPFEQVAAHLEPDRQYFDARRAQFAQRANLEQILLERILLEQILLHLKIQLGSRVPVLGYGSADRLEKRLEQVEGLPRDVAR